jgi:RHH-type proline utilization regulon transcriptional repressor/proline dehydrogenase/delta 1-pyrroline-5-carboxylate dehydrogenase
LRDVSDVSLVQETDAGLVERLQAGAVGDRLRVWEPISTDVRVAANRAHVAVIDWPVLANGRLELRGYLREQTLSHVIHRYGNIIDPSPRTSPTGA